MNAPDDHPRNFTVPDALIQKTPADDAETADKLLAGYRIGAIAATCSFVIFAAFLTAVVLVQRMHFFMLLLLLLSGFLWIGMTSICRHSFILLKRHIGVEVGQLEFLSTQFVFLHSPIRYRKVRKEVEIYKEKKLAAGDWNP